MITEKQESEMSMLAQLLIERSSIYRLLVRLYDKEVDGEIAQIIKGLGSARTDSAQAGSAGSDWAGSAGHAGHAQAGSTQLEAENEFELKMQAGINAMAQNVSSFDEGVENSLACEYARVFLAAGICDGKAALPYESVYTSDEKLIMQDSRDEVRAIFREHGIMPGSDWDAPEDYLPYELEYMALLAEEAANSLQQRERMDVLSSLAKQKDFLAAHILNWYGDFASEGRSVAKTGFYRGLFDFTEGYLRFDQDTIAALENDLRAALPSKADAPQTKGGD
jgi:anaerobic sulfite reductase subunit A